MSSQANRDPEPSRLDIALGELEDLLAIEESALSRLDAPSIEATTEKKNLLFADLLQVLELQRPGAAQRARLERIRAAQLKNQLLLVHARDAVRGALALALGEPAAARFTPAPSSRGGAVVLSVRG